MSEISRKEQLRSDPGRGVVYTKPNIVRFCLDLVERVSTEGWLNKRILDIGCGYGQFIGQVTDRIVDEALESDIEFDGFIESLGRSLRGVEVRSHTGQIARRTVRDKVAEKYGTMPPRLILERVVQIDDFLNWSPNPAKFDIIVGNIPYVRYAKISELPHVESRELLRKEYSTFIGRADYSVPFLERILDLLDNNGIAVLITSNRFTRAEYGRNIRREIVESDVSVQEIDIGRLRAFESEVSAYASVFLISRTLSKASRYIRVDSTDDVTLKELVAGFPHRVDDSEAIAVKDRNWRGRDYGEPWGRRGSSVRSILEKLAAKYRTVEGAGFRVRKGPATGANKVFIGQREQFSLSKSSANEFLVPIFVTKRNGGEGRGEASKQFILSVFEKHSAQLLCFEAFPRDVQAYLEANRSALEDRYIVKVSGREWWRTIDRFDPAFCKETKVLVPDLQMGDAVVLDEGEHLPSHSTVCIWGGDEERLRGLALVLRSRVAEEFRFLHSPDMGRRSPRASANVLRDLPIPPDDALIRLAVEHENPVAVLDAYELSEEERQLLTEKRSTTSS